MTKHEQYYQEMISQNRDLFETFRTIHDNYLINPDAWQEKLNSLGSEVMDIIKVYEDRLCGKSESTKYGKFSTGLSEKFWSLVRHDFPKIDFIGVKRS